MKRIGNLGDRRIRLTLCRKKNRLHLESLDCESCDEIRVHHRPSPTQTYFHARDGGKTYYTYGSRSKTEFVDHNQIYRPEERSSSPSIGKPEQRNWETEGCVVNPRLDPYHTYSCKHASTWSHQETDRRRAPPHMCRLRACLRQTRFVRP